MYATLEPKVSGASVIPEITSHGLIYSITPISLASLVLFVFICIYYGYIIQYKQYLFISNFISKGLLSFLPITVMRIQEIMNINQ